MLNMEKELEIIKTAFSHFIYEEEVYFGDERALIYFPSIGFALFEGKDEVSQRRIEQALEGHFLKTKHLVRAIFINTEEEGYNVGYVIQDILLEGGFIPS